MNTHSPYRHTGKALAAAKIGRQFPEPELRIVGRHYGKSLLGPEFDIALGDRYFRIGALTLRLLEKGTPASDLDMLEIDLDAEEETY